MAMVIELSERAAARVAAAAAAKGVSETEIVEDLVTLSGCKAVPNSAI